MRRLLLILFLFTGLSVGVSQAQSAAWVHFNQPFYVAGEVIWYKLYLPDNFPEGPKVITVSLVNPSGELVEQSYLRRRQDVSVSGFYRVPFDWRSGAYRLVFSVTKEGTHEPLVLAETLLPIYDDLEKQAVSLTGPAVQIPKTNLSTPLRVSVETTQAAYAPGSSASIQIKVQDEQGNPVEGEVSIAVRDQQLFALEEAGFNSFQAGKVLMDTANWEEDINLRGRLLNPEDRAPLPAGNIAAYLMEAYQFLYAKADSTGRFTLDLPDLYGKIPMHILGFFPENILVDLELIPELSALPQAALPYPDEVRQYLELSQKRKLIYQLYGRLEQELEAVYPKMSYEKPEADRPVPLDEYDAFPDLARMARDLSIPVRFRKWEKDRLGVRIFDPSQTLRSYYSDRPLFVVDGMLTRDDQFIAELDITKLEQFDLFYAFDRLLELFGPIARYGLVRIESRNRNVAVPKVDQKNYFRLKGFPAEVDYPISVKSSEDTPVQLRPSLYWQPEARTNERGELSLSIPLTDDQSRFQIEVVVQDAQGHRGGGTATFTVKQGRK